MCNLYATMRLWHTNCRTSLQSHLFGTDDLKQKYESRSQIVPFPASCRSFSVILNGNIWFMESLGTRQSVFVSPRSSEKNSEIAQIVSRRANRDGRISPG